MSTPSTYTCDYLIIGGGITGLMLALKLRERFPQNSVAILEKESSPSQHASGRNSGVIHAGFYYSHDSLKARLCIAGNKALKDFCRSHGIRLNECGKLVVATEERELPGLDELERRGRQNGAKVEMISEADAKKLEPGVQTLGKALYSPATATADPKEISAAVTEELLGRGVEIFCDTKFIRRLSEGSIETTRGKFSAGMIFNTAGLYADKIAHQFGFGSNYTILPFKGLYLKYKKNTTDVRMNVYPVPDPAFPFLGVHFTKTVDGGIKIGPTAIPAFWRENYSGFRNFNLGEFLQIGAREAGLFFSNAFNFRTFACEELRKYWRTYFIRLSQKLVPSIDPNGFGEFTAPGIRAQLLNKKTHELVQDFIVEGDSRSIHVLNAVSPAWTCSLPFADYIIDNFVAR